MQTDACIAYDLSRTKAKFLVEIRELEKHSPLSPAEFENKLNC